MACQGCAERREKIKATMMRIAEWARSPQTKPSPLSPLRPTVQTTPPRPRPVKDK